MRTNCDTENVEMTVLASINEFTTDRGENVLCMPVIASIYI